MSMLTYIALADKISAAPSAISLTDPHGADNCTSPDSLLDCGSTEVVGNTYEYVSQLMVTEDCDGGPKITMMSQDNSINNITTIMCGLDVSELSETVAGLSLPIGIVLIYSDVGCYIDRS